MRLPFTVFALAVAMPCATACSVTPDEERAIGAGDAAPGAPLLAPRAATASRSFVHDGRVRGVDNWACNAMTGPRLTL